jgi:predicted nuclease of predicted toxin-antitoxin system
MPGDCVVALRQGGHDVLWIRETAPGSPDSVVLSIAQSEERLLITFDKDFGELVYRRAAAASLGIVLLRLRKRSPDYLAKHVMRVLESRAGQDTSASWMRIPFACGVCVDTDVNQILETIKLLLLNAQ